MSYKFFFFACALNLFYYAQNLFASPVIGGYKDTDDAHKYHVSIQEGHNHYDLNSGKVFCGGAIIDVKYILTAAHCFMTKKDGTIKFIRKLRARKVVVVAGTSETYGPGIITDVRKVFIPHAYRDLGQNKYGDIAIVQLAMDFSLTFEIGRVEIFELDRGQPLNFYENENAVVPGNGCDAIDTGVDGVLRPHPHRVAQFRQVLEVYILERSHCPLEFDHSICAVSRDRSEIRACSKGDSGSPLVYGNSIIGVLSQGPEIFEKDRLYTMMFTRVSTFIKFISDAMNEHADHTEMHTIKD